MPSHFDSALQFLTACFLYVFNVTLYYCDISYVDIKYFLLLNCEITSKLVFCYQNLSKHNSYYKILLKRLFLVNCLIMTSGTLAPLESFRREMEMEMEIPIRREHISDQNQVFARILCNGVDGEPFNSKYSNRYLKSKTHSISLLCNNFNKFYFISLLIAETTIII